MENRFSFLAVATGAFFISLFLSWFLLIWNIFTSLGQFWGVSLGIAVFAGLISWIRGHFRALDERITNLEHELEKLRRRS